jgi:L-threonylcarbamoyladenylate synthase
MSDTPKKLENAVNLAAALLKQGKLVAIPTETVYGLAADASQPEAIRQIFMAKGRPSDHPLIVHLADVSQIWDWGKNLSPETRQDISLLAQHFWPGPLTLVIKKADWVPNVITGGQDTVAIRIPNHPLALALLKQMPNGLVAPSANRFGRISPTTPAHVQKELGDKVAYILDGGPCNVGIESTIVNLSGEHPVILRPGMISHAQISVVLNKPVLLLNKNKQDPITAIRAPGVLDSHYAPKTAFYRILDPDILITELISQLTITLPNKKIALISQRSLDVAEDNKTAVSSLITYHGLSSDPETFSQKIYGILHELDESGLDYIFCHLDEQIIQKNIIWQSILDRLNKATLDSLSLNQIKLITG